MPLTGGRSRLVPRLLLLLLLGTGRIRGIAVRGAKEFGFRTNTGHAGGCVMGAGKERGAVVRIVGVMSRILKVLVHVSARRGIVLGARGRMMVMMMMGGGMIGVPARWRCCAARILVILLLLLGGVRLLVCSLLPVDGVATGRASRLVITFALFNLTRTSITTIMLMWW